MTLKYKVILFLATVVTAFAIGRYSAQPSTVKTIVDAHNVTDAVTNRDTHRETTTVTEKEPNGVTKTTTKTVEDTTSKKQVDSNSDIHQVQTVTPSKSNNVNISTLVGMDLRTYSPVYGGSISKEFIGPITLGAFGLTNGTFGVSIGVNF